MAHFINLSPRHLEAELLKIATLRSRKATNKEV